MTFTSPGHTQCMNSKGKLTFYIVNSDKACISTELADLIYDNIERNQVLRIETIKQELCKPEKEEQMMVRYNEKQEKNPRRYLLI